MARPHKPDQPDQEPRRGKRQPYARKKDWQQAGEWSSKRSNTGHPQLNQFLDAEAAKRDEFLNTEMRVDYDDLGKRRFVHKLVMSGDFNPMKIAAVATGVSVTFTFVAIILGITGHPGSAVATLALALVPLLAAIALALYESQTRRIEAQADTAAAMELAQTKSVAVIVPSTPAEIDVKPEPLLRQPLEEPPTPRALDGGEPTA